MENINYNGEYNIFHGVIHCAKYRIIRMTKYAREISDCMHTQPALNLAVDRHQNLLHKIMRTTVHLSLL